MRTDAESRITRLQIHLQMRDTRQNIQHLLYILSHMAAWLLILTAVACLCLQVQVILRSSICYAEDAATPADSAGGAEASSGAGTADGGAERCTEILKKVAEDFAAAAGEAYEDVIYPPVTRKEVYVLKSGTRVPRKEIRRRGGAGRWFQIYKIGTKSRVYRRIAGRSYRPGGAVPLSDLRYVRVLYFDFRGKTRTGEIIVNKSIASDTISVFRSLYKARYQIRKMRLVDDYFPSVKTPSWSSVAAEAADTASMNDDNTSGFNYRMVAGTSRVSMHGYGRAIDVNPFENPWCPGGRIYYNQKESASYADRKNVRPHMISAGSDITKIFKEHGFRWLGEAWTRDYQHFEK